MKLFKGLWVFCCKKTEAATKPGSEAAILIRSVNWIVKVSWKKYDIICSIILSLCQPQGLSMCGGLFTCLCPEAHCLVLYVIWPWSVSSGIRQRIVAAAIKTANSFCQHQTVHVVTWAPSSCLIEGPALGFIGALILRHWTPNSFRWPSGSNTTFIFLAHRESHGWMTLETTTPTPQPSSDVG